MGTEIDVLDAMYAVSPLLALVVGGLFMMLVDAFVKERAELALTAFWTFVVAGGLAAGLWIGGTPASPGIVTSYLAVDQMALFFDIVICGGGAFTALLAGGYLPEHGLERGEFYVLLVFSAFGAMLLARATDLLSLFIGLETMSLGVYCMVAFRRGSSRSAEGVLHAVTQAQGEDDAEGGGHCWGQPGQGTARRRGEQHQQVGGRQQQGGGLKRRAHPPRRAIAAEQRSTQIQPGGCGEQVQADVHEVGAKHQALGGGGQQQQAEQGGSRQAAGVLNALR